VAGRPRLRSVSTGCIQLPRVQTSIGQCQSTSVGSLQSSSYHECRHQSDSASPHQLGLCNHPATTSADINRTVPVHISWVSAIIQLPRVQTSIGQCQSTSVGSLQSSSYHECRHQSDSASSHQLGLCNHLTSTVSNDRLVLNRCYLGIYPSQLYPRTKWLQGFLAIVSQPS